MNFFNCALIKKILGFPTLCSLLYLNIYIDKELFLENPFTIKNAIIPLNLLYSYYIYNNRFYYLNLTLDYILNFKLYIQKIFKNDNNDKFSIGTVLLYTDLENNIEITEYFKKNNIKYIDKNLIKNLYSEYMINMDDNIHIRLKIFYRFNDNNYIMYFPYTNSDYIPYPPYSNEIMESFRNDLIIPTYTYVNKKKYIYPVFSTECKDIHHVKLNDNEEESLLNYFNKIKGPFNDFGILYNTPVLLRWILSENKYNIEQFQSLYIKFLSVYFDETDFELKEHYIEMNKEMLDNILISKRIDNILLEK
jgi:hypothetical protein